MGSDSIAVTQFLDLTKAMPINLPIRLFNKDSAIQTAIIEQSVKFNQVISITGANGRMIDVTFEWIRNNDGVVRLATGIPAKNEHEIF
jgi:hypothetical protein